jgi:hypothetical protein
VEHARALAIFEQEKNTFKKTRNFCGSAKPKPIVGQPVTRILLNSHQRQVTVWDISVDGSRKGRQNRRSTNKQTLSRPPVFSVRMRYNRKEKHASTLAPRGSRCRWFEQESVCEQATRHSLNCDCLSASRRCTVTGASLLLSH